MRILSTPLLLALPAAAPAMAEGNPFCILTLKACDYDREDAGACPTGSSATATLFAEGEYWYLDTVGITTDPANGVSTATELLNLATSGTTGDGTTVYYIIAREGLDGALHLGADGVAKLTLTGDAGPDKAMFEKYYTGTCEAPQP